MAKGDEFTVNDDGDVTTTDDFFNDQLDAAVAGFADGGYIVTWRSDQGDGNGDAIISQRFNSSGNRVGGQTVVNVAQTIGNQVDPAVATLTDGSGNNAGHVVVFGTQGGDVFARVFDSGGSPLGTEFLVNTTTASSQVDAMVVGLQGGGFVVVWTDNGGADGSGSGIFAQVFQNDGTTVGSEFQVNVEFSSTQDQPSVAATSDGGFRGELDFRSLRQRR